MIRTWCEPRPFRIKERKQNMILFNSDYTEGAHPQVMEKLSETNFVQTVGYGEDEYCKEARALIKKACKNDEIDVHFLVGGTQANTVVIASALRPHQGVIAADTGHINVHETGAIEATGHKVLALPNQDGKITSKQIEEVYKEHKSDDAFEHVVQPKMVYISHPTEMGTLYSKDELEKIRKVCDESGFLLFLDGARLGYGLMAPETDVTLEFLSNVCDVFYIGGTKVGALFGEAVVIRNPHIKEDFRYMIKQRGGMLAKGRLLGIQFGTLFTDDLYMEISRHAIDLSMLIKKELTTKGYQFAIDSKTNQQFIILSNEKYQILQEKYGLTFWEKYDESQSVIRICTSWATKKENVLQLIEDME